MQVGLENIVSDASMEYVVKRKNSGRLENGNWIEEVELNLIMNLMISFAKKSDYQLFNMGGLSYQLIKIRQMKTDINLIKNKDTFVFEGYNFKVIKPKLYANNTLPFYIWYAVTEVDAVDI